MNNLTPAEANAKKRLRCGQGTGWRKVIHVWWVYEKHGFVWAVGIGWVAGFVDLGRK